MKYSVLQGMGVILKLYNIQRLRENELIQN